MLSDVIDVQYNKLSQELEDSPPEIRLLKADYGVVKQELARQVSMLNNLMEESINPGTASIDKLAHNMSSFKALISKMNTSGVGTAKFGQVMAYVMAGMGTTAAAAKLVDEALKTVGMSVSQYSGLKKFKSLRDELDSGTSKQLKGDNNALSKYEHAKEMILNFHHSHDDIAKLLSEKKGKGEDSEVFGGLKLDRSTKERNNLRNSLLTTFSRLLNSNLTKMLKSAKTIAAGLSTGKIKSDDYMEMLAKSLDSIPNLTDKRNIYSLSGYDRSREATQYRESFLGCVNNVLTALDYLCKSDRGDSFKEMKKAFEDIKDMILAYSEKFEKGFSDYKVGGNDEAPRLTISTQDFDLEKTKNILLYYTRVAKIRESFARANKEMNSAGSDYDKILGDAVGDLIDKAYTEQKSWMSKFESPSDPVSHLFKHKGEKDEIKRFKEKHYKIRISLYKTAEAIDIYLKSFTDSITSKPEEVKNITNMLNNIEVISKWHDDHSGDLLCNLFDSFPSAYAGKDPKWSHLPAATKKKDMKDLHYYERVAAVCEFGAAQFNLAFMTQGNAQPSNYTRDTLSTMAVARANYETSVGKPGDAINAAYQSLPGNPFLGVPIYDGNSGTKKTFINDMEKYLEKSASVNMLKNIIAVFVNIADKFGDKSAIRESPMSPIDIFKNLSNYLKYSSLAMGLDRLQLTKSVLVPGLGSALVGGAANVSGNTYNAGTNVMNVGSGTGVISTHRNVGGSLEQKIKDLLLVGGRIAGNVNELDRTSAPLVAYIAGNLATRAPTQKDNMIKCINLIHSIYKDLYEFIKDVTNVSTEIPKYKNTVSLKNIKKDFDKIKDIINLITADKYISDALGVAAAVAAGPALGHPTNFADLVMRRLHAFLTASSNGNVAGDIPAHTEIANEYVKKVQPLYMKDDTIDALLGGMNIHPQALPNLVAEIGLTKYLRDNMFELKVSSDQAKNIIDTDVVEPTNRDDLLFREVGYVGMRGVETKQGYDGDYSPFHDIYSKDCDQLFTLIVKSMVAKVMTAVGTFNIFHKSSTPEGMGYKPSVRKILGGDEGVKVIDDAMEIYVRIPLLLQFYHKIFALKNVNDNNPYNPRGGDKILAIVPEMDNVFGGIVRLVFVDTNGDANYSDTDIRMIIEECNKIYVTYKGKPFSVVVNDLIAEVNARYGIVAKSDSKMYESLIKGLSVDNDIDDYETVQEFELNGVDDTEWVSKPAPSDKYVHFSDSITTSRSHHNVTADISTDYELVRNLHGKIDSEFARAASVNNKDGFRSSVSFTNRISSLKEQLSSAITEEDRFSVARTAIKGLANESSLPALEYGYLIAHEMVLTPLAVLRATNESIDKFTKNIDKLYVIAETIKKFGSDLDAIKDVNPQNAMRIMFYDNAAAADNGVGGNRKLFDKDGYIIRTLRDIHNLHTGETKDIAYVASAYKDFSPVSGLEYDNATLSMLNVTPYGMQLKSSSYSIQFGKPLNNAGVHKAFRFKYIAKAISESDNAIKKNASKGMIQQYAFNLGTVFRAFFENIYTFCTNNELIKISVNSGHDMSSNKGTATINFNISGLRENTQRLFTEIKNVINKLRTVLPKDLIDKLEKEEENSIHKLEKSLLEDKILGKSNYDKSLGKYSDKLQKILNVIQGEYTGDLSAIRSGGAGGIANATFTPALLSNEFKMYKEDFKNAGGHVLANNYDANKDMSIMYPYVRDVYHMIFWNNNREGSITNYGFDAGLLIGANTLVAVDETGMKIPGGGGDLQNLAKNNHNAILYAKDVAYSTNDTIQGVYGLLKSPIANEYALGKLAAPPDNVRFYDRLFDPKVGFKNDCNRGIVITFNRLCLYYLSIIWSTDNTRVYKTTVEHFVNESFSHAIRGNDNIKIDGNVLKNVPRHVMFREVSELYKILYTLTVKNKPDKVYIENDLNEIPTYIRDKYRGYFPQVINLCRNLITRCELMSEFVSTLNVAQYGNLGDGVDGLIIAPVSAIEGRTYKKCLERGRAYLKHLLTETIKGCNGLIKCMEDTLMELGESPNYMELYQGFGNDYKTLTKKNVFAPLSSTTYFLQTSRLSDKYAEIYDNKTYDIIQHMRDGEPTETKKKLLNGIRPFMGKIDKQYMKYYDSIVEIYNKNVDPKFKVVDYSTMLSLYSSFYKYNFDIMKTKKILSLLYHNNYSLERFGVVDLQKLVGGGAGLPYANIAAAAAAVPVNIFMVTLLANVGALGAGGGGGANISARIYPGAAITLHNTAPGNAAIAANIVRWHLGFTFNMHSAVESKYFTLTDDHGHVDLKKLLPYQADSADITGVVEITESTNRKSQKDKLVGVFNNNNRSSVDTDTLRVYNIIDLNVMPINVNALMREVPFTNLYNYAATFDTFIKELLGSTSFDAIQPNVDLSSAGFGGIQYQKRGLEMLSLMCRSPYQKMTFDVFDAYFAQTMRGNVGVPGLGVPRYLADEVYNKALFGEVIGGPEYVEEIGPAAGDVVNSYGNVGLNRAKLFTFLGEYFFDRHPFMINDPPIRRSYLRGLLPSGISQTAKGYVLPNNYEVLHGMACMPFTAHYSKHFGIIENKQGGDDSIWVELPTQITLKRSMYEFLEHYYNSGLDINFDGSPGAGGRECFGAINDKINRIIYINSYCDGLADVGDLITGTVATKAGVYDFSGGNSTFFGAGAADRTFTVALDPGYGGVNCLGAVVNVAADENSNNKACLMPGILYHGAHTFKIAITFGIVAGALGTDFDNNGAGEKTINAAGMQAAIRGFTGRHIDGSNIDINAYVGRDVANFDLAGDGNPQNVRKDSRGNGIRPILQMALNRLRTVVNNVEEFRPFFNENLGNGNDIAQNSKLGITILSANAEMNQGVVIGGNFCKIAYNNIPTYMGDIDNLNRVSASPEMVPIVNNIIGRSINLKSNNINMIRLKDQHPQLMHWREKSSTQDGDMELKSVNVGDFKLLLKHIGKIRFDTVLVRNLVWLTNVHRLLRLKLRQDLMWYDSAVVSSHLVTNSNITELKMNRGVYDPANE
jgi:hypothetical protein